MLEVRSIWNFSVHEVIAIGDCPFYGIGCNNFLATKGSAVETINCSHRNIYLFLIYLIF